MIMFESKGLADYEDEAFRNSVLIDKIYIQAKNITALKKDVLPIIYRLCNKRLEAFCSLKKRKMFQDAGDGDSAKACLIEAEQALYEAKKADKDLLQTIKRKGYHISGSSLIA